MLAILKAGCAFTSLDPQHPKSRLREIVTDLNAVLVLCSPHCLPICNSIATNTLAIDLQMLRQLPIKLSKLPACATSSVAYAIFTSGTTGRPKGIPSTLSPSHIQNFLYLSLHSIPYANTKVVHHAAFCSGASKFAPALLIRPESRVLQFASYTFDACLIEILATLIIGGCVCIPDESSRLNAIADVINDMHVDTALLTPSVAQMIKPSEVPGLRTLILAGEAMSAGHLSTWAGKLDLINAYGPSECSVVAAVKSHMSMNTAPTNIGHSIDTCWIVDPSDHDILLPIGAIGELLIEGPTLARGYINNDAKTSESFIRNLKWAMNDRRMYKTGDLVRYAPNDSGEIIYIGRKDNQAKLHGQRLELEEVEYYLNANPAVQHALAVVPKAGRCAEKLVAVISLQDVARVLSTSGELEMVPSSSASMALPGIKENLRSCLPPYMIPANWVILLSLPLLASGKLDRRRVESFVESVDENLYQRITSSGSSDATENLEITYLERRFQVIWSQALGLPAESIPLNCSFLHLVSNTLGRQCLKKLMFFFSFLSILGRR
jgi:acyl-CoA synthetase (AMP-forming)/AMP-acid ligase II